MVFIGYEAFAIIKKVYFLLLVLGNFLVLYAIILLPLQKIINTVHINTTNFK